MKIPGVLVSGVLAALLLPAQAPVPRGKAIEAPDHKDVALAEQGARLLQT